MSITQDILATYRSPKAVALKRQANGPREDRALAVLMAACIVIFVAQWPQLARNAHLEEGHLNQLIGASLLGWVFFAPLFFYGVAFASQMVMRALGGTPGYKARMALFWALLAGSPLALFNGLVAGFVGPGILNNLTSLLWLAAIFWFWIAGLSASRQEGL